MRRAQVPITTLPAWAKLNDVSFIDIIVQERPLIGYGLITLKDLKSNDASNQLKLLRIPKALVLSRESIDEHAKIDNYFQVLQSVVDPKPVRLRAILFLLMQWTMTSPDVSCSVGVSSPWTEYLKFIPSIVPVPTRWTDEDREGLVGTSLESAVTAKLAALQREFDDLRDKTDAIPWCQKAWWTNDILKFDDWITLDSWYRSRTLEIPGAGECMVPCLDMANHSSNSNAYYEVESGSGDLLLLLKPDQILNNGEEIHISYGSDKSAAEMLFSYGFIPSNVQKKCVLDLQPFSEDPLGKAKTVAFGKPLTVNLSIIDDNFAWKSPSVWLLCLNEEDGLDFRVLQHTDGSRSQLRVFWRETEVTENIEDLEDILDDFPLQDIIRLRAVVFLQSRIQDQYEKLVDTERLARQNFESGSIAAYGRQLCEDERFLLESARSGLELQKSTLLQNEVVLEYLSVMAGDGQTAMDQSEEDHDEDFS